MVLVIDKIPNLLAVVLFSSNIEKYTPAHQKVTWKWHTIALSIIFLMVASCYRCLQMAVVWNMCKQMPTALIDSNTWTTVTLYGKTTFFLARDEHHAAMPEVPGYETKVKFAKT